MLHLKQEITSVVLHFFLPTQHHIQDVSYSVHGLGIHVQVDCYFSLCNAINLNGGLLSSILGPWSQWKGQMYWDKPEALLLPHFPKLQREQIPVFTLELKISI